MPYDYKPGTSVAPRAVELADTTTDATEEWAKERDPENERGELCTAYLDFDGEFTTLVGLSVKDESGTIYFDRMSALRILSTETVYEIEGYENNHNHERAAGDYQANRAAWR